VDAKPDVIFTQTDAATAAVVFQNFKEANNLAIPFVGTDVTGGDDYLKAVTYPVAHDHLISVYGTSVSGQAADEFNKQFAAALGSSQQPLANANYAYDAVISARRLPKDTEEQKAERARRIALANRHAAEVPMRTARAAVRLLAALPELAEKGNPNAVSDVGAAALLMDACVEAALLNVGINLSGIDDAGFVTEMQRETADLQEESRRLRSQVVALVRKRF